MFHCLYKAKNIKDNKEYTHTQQVYIVHDAEDAHLNGVDFLSTKTFSPVVVFLLLPMVNLILEDLEGLLGSANAITVQMLDVLTLSAC